MKSLAVILSFASAVIPLAATTAPTVAVQVMYIENNNTITTYDVDRNTGKATQVGQPVTIASAQYLGPINSVLNGQLRLQSLLGPGSRHCLWNHCSAPG